MIRNSTTTQVVFLGTPHFAEVILKQLIASPFQPQLVITEPDRPVGRKQILTPPPVKVVAEASGIPVVQPTNHQELLTCLAAEQPILGIVAAYGRILRPDVLTLPAHGFLNVHASLLPKYRGASPIQAAILAGETETGVTIMQIDAGLDTGPIVSWAPVAIELNETTPQLSQRLAEAGSALLLETLPGYLAGMIVSHPQPAEGISVTRLLTKESGRLTGQETPEQILHMLRAYLPWPGVWLEIGDQRIILLAAHLANGRLSPDQLQLAGKKPVDWETFERDRPEFARKINDFLDN